MIDLRSDVCLNPSAEVWTAMRAASPGWPLMGEDAAVNRLESVGAELLGKAAAVLAPTCSQANLAALMSLADPGGEVWVGRTAHIVTSEAMGAEQVAGLRVRLLEDESGSPEVPAGIGLLCLENTHTRSGGRVLDSSATSELAGRAERVHLDGARLFNAAVALGVEPRLLAGPADTVAVSLNKGLRAPLGALLAGSAEIVERCRWNLKRIGGASVHGMGLFAAGALVAIGAIDRLAEDHRRAARLAELIGAPAPATNIVILTTPGPAAAFRSKLARRGVLAYPHSDTTIRFVTHGGVGDEEIERAGRVVMDCR